MTEENKLKTLQRRIHSPKTDLLENDYYIIVRMEIPVDEFRWEIKDDNTILFVSYEKKEPIYKYDNLRIVYSETKYGKGMRRVKLPCKIKELISQEFECGVLILYFQKMDDFNSYTIDNGISTTIDWNYV